jgi:hypothetical protein
MASFVYPNKSVDNMSVDNKSVDNMSYEGDDDPNTPAFYGDQVNMSIEGNFINDNNEYIWYVNLTYEEEEGESKKLEKFITITLIGKELYITTKCNNNTINLKCIKEDKDIESAITQFKIQYHPFFLNFTTDNSKLIITYDGTFFSNDNGKENNDRKTIELPCSQNIKKITELISYQSNEKFIVSCNNGNYNGNDENDNNDNDENDKKSKIVIPIYVDDTYKKRSEIFNENKFLLRLELDWENLHDKKAIQMFIIHDRFIKKDLLSIEKLDNYMQITFPIFCNIYYVNLYFNNKKPNPVLTFVVNKNRRYLKFYISNAKVTKYDIKNDYDNDDNYIIDHKKDKYNRIVFKVNLKNENNCFISNPNIKNIIMTELNHNIIKKFQAKYRSDEITDWVDLDIKQEESFDQGESFDKKEKSEFANIGNTNLSTISTNAGADERSNDDDATNKVNNDISQDDLSTIESASSSEEVNDDQQQEEKKEEVKEQQLEVNEVQPQEEQEEEKKYKDGVGLFDVKVTKDNILTHRNTGEILVSNDKSNINSTGNESRESREFQDVIGLFTADVKKILENQMSNKGDSDANTGADDKGETGTKGVDMNENKRTTPTPPHTPHTPTDYHDIDPNTNADPVGENDSSKQNQDATIKNSFSENEKDNNNDLSNHNHTGLIISSAEKLLAKKLF